MNGTENEDLARLLKMKLLRNDVLVEWEEARDTYGPSTILRPDTHKARHYTGMVISIGPDVWDVKIGDRVFFDQFSRPERYDFDGKRYAQITENDCMAILPLRAEVYA